MNMYKHSKTGCVFFESENNKGIYIPRCLFDMYYREEVLDKLLIS